MTGKKKPRLLDVGPGGELRLPPDAIEAMGLEPGEQVEIFVDTRRKSVRLERHVDDPWSEALKQKPSKDFDDLLSEQSQREREAERLFEEGLKKRPPPRKPEDDPDLWR